MPDRRPAIGPAGNAVDYLYLLRYTCVMPFDHIAARAIVSRKFSRQQDAADAMGVHREFLNRLLAGHVAKPDLATVEKLAEAMGVKITKLLKPESEKISADGA